MYKFEIPMVEETTYTNLPSYMMNCIEPWLIRNQVRYTAFYGERIPAILPQTYTFCDRTSVLGVCCIKSHMDSAALITAAEKMLLIEKNQI